MIILPSFFHANTVPVLLFWKIFYLILSFFSKLYLKGYFHDKKKIKITLINEPKSRCGHEVYQVLCENEQSVKTCPSLTMHILIRLNICY